MEDRQPERRRQILEAALRVFSTKGFHQATNKDIAQAAGGISPGLIYWYFKDKEDLFLELVRDRATILDLVEHPERLMDLPPREGLTLFARTYMGIFNNPLHAAFFRMAFGEIARLPQLRDMFYQRFASRLFGTLQRYLERQVQRGLLRPHDTGTATRSFFGSLVVQVLARELLRDPAALQTPDDVIIATVVEIFVRGLEP